MIPNSLKYTPVTIKFSSNKDGVKQAYEIQLLDIKNVLRILKLPALKQARLELMEMRAIVEHKIANWAN